MGFPNLGALYLIALSARPSSKEGCPGTLVVLSPLRRMSIRMVELADALLGGVFYGPFVSALVVFFVVIPSFSLRLWGSRLRSGALRF